MAMIMQTVERKRLFESIVEQIHATILSGQLAPGDALPPEREMCEKFGASRTSVRAAISALEALGLVQSTNGKLTRVKKAVPEESGEILSIVLFHDLENVGDLYECRRFVESWIAYYAAAKLTDEQLKHLESVDRKRTEAIAAGGNGRSLDFEFHWSLAQYAGNEPAARIVYGLLRAVFTMVPAHATEAEEQRASFARHQKLLAALRARDRAGAMRAMWRHLTDATSPSDAQPFPLSESGAVRKRKRKPKAVK